MPTYCYDRNEPMSYEDFLCQGKSARECAEIRQRLADEETRREMEEADELAHLEERQAAEASR